MQTWTAARACCLRRRDDKQARGEGERHNSLARTGFVPAYSDQAVRNPSADRLAHAENEEGERGVKAGSEDRQLPHRHQIVRQPGHKQVPVIVKTEKPEANAEKVTIA